MCVWARSQPASGEGAVIGFAGCFGVEVGLSKRADFTVILCRNVKQILPKPITFFYDYMMMRRLVLYEGHFASNGMTMINLHNYLKYLEIKLQAFCLNSSKIHELSTQKNVRCCCSPRPPLTSHSRDRGLGSMSLRPVAPRCRQVFLRAGACGPVSLEKKNKQKTHSMRWELVFFST